MVIDRKAVESLRRAWHAGQPPADPWSRADPRHRTAWAYAPRRLDPDFIPTMPTTRDVVRRLVECGGAIATRRM
jgi:hypothetical protein